MTQEIIKIYTDGSCLGNPGRGGWGAILIYKNIEKKISGSIAMTTNNKMELTAPIEALKIIKKSSNIEIYTDSSYVKNGITSWIHNWKKNNWRNSKKQPVKNIELWQELDHISQQHKVNWHWVKAHNGDKYNEIADELATNASISDIYD